MTRGLGRIRTISEAAHARMGDDRRAAVLTICGQARDADDARLLIEALGLVEDLELLRDERSLVTE